MPKLFLSKLERHFYAAADIRCAKVDAGGCFNRKSSSLGVDKSYHFVGKGGIGDDNSFWKIGEGEFCLVLPVRLFLAFSFRIQYFKPKSTNLAGEMGQLAEAILPLTTQSRKSNF